MGSASFKTFLLALVFAPLAFGAVETWSLAAVEGLSFLSLFLLTLSFKKNRGRLYSVPGTTPLVFFLSYVLLQAVPLPAAVVKALSPKAHEIYGVLEYAGNTPAWIPLSVDPKSTLLEFLRLASYGAFYFVAVQLLADRDRLRRAVFLAAVTVSTIAFLSLLQFAVSGGEKVLFLREAPDNARPFGPYVNRNHYAGLMGMTFPLVLSLLLFAFPSARYSTLKKNFTKMFSEERYSAHFLGFSAVVMITTVLLSLSRGGILSLGLSAVFYFVLLRRAGGKKGSYLLPVAILILLSMGWFGWDPIINRFETAVSAPSAVSDLRPAIWRDSLKLVKDFPLTGAGLGSFAAIYPSYGSMYIADRSIDHAHNDYLELLAEGGLVALGLAGWFLLSVLSRAVSNFRKRRDPYAIYVSIGCFAGVLYMALHSITDFNLHIGANGLYFFFLLGLCVSASSTRLKGMPGHLAKSDTGPGRVAAASGLLLFAGLLFNLGIVAGERIFSKVGTLNSTGRVPVSNITSIRDTAARASALDPLEAKYHYAAGTSGLLLGDRTPASSGRLLKAARLRPTNGECLQQIGFLCSAEGRVEQAERLLLAGISRDISNPLRHENYGAWLLSQGEKEKGKKALKEAMALDPATTRRALALMVLYGLSDDEMTSALPEAVEPRLVFAGYIARTTEKDKAKAAFLDALSYADTGPVEARHFYTARDYFLSECMVEEALGVMLKAVGHFPDNAEVRLALAALYERMGLSYRAKEEYQKALVLDPENVYARERLKALR